MIHQNIPPVRAFVEQTILYNMDPEYQDKYEACTIFGVSSYPLEALTAHVMLGNGSIFSYVPFHKLLNKPEEPNPKLELDDLVYKNCPDEHIAVHNFEFLEGEVDAYFKRKDLWLPGHYLATVDWYESNELFHLIKLENYPIAAVPNHKLKFKGADRSFPPYKKLRQTWEVSVA